MGCTAVGIEDGYGGERCDDVRCLLLERQRELRSEIRIRVRDVREVGSNNHHHATDLRETVEVEPEDDLMFALIQLKGEMLESVTQAIRHCDEGTYGYCLDCGEVIPSIRLRAMPFAVRCRECEETREDEQHRERGQLQSGRQCLDSRY
jgi:DnaK suppressor protein